MAHVSQAIDPVLNVPCPQCDRAPKEIVPVIEGGEPWGFPFFGHWKHTPLRVTGYKWIYCGHVNDLGRPVWFIDTYGRKQGHWIGHDENPEVFRHRTLKSQAAFGGILREGLRALEECKHSEALNVATARD